MEETRYADAFIYVPTVREIVRIAEGNGMNLQYALFGEEVFG